MRKIKVHVEDDDGLDLTRKVVLRQDRLTGDLEVLNLDIHTTQALREGVDLDESRVDSLIELSEASDETDGALVDLLEGVTVRWEAGERGKDRGERIRWTKRQKRKREKSEKRDEDGGEGGSREHRDARTYGQQKQQGMEPRVPTMEPCIKNEESLGDENDEEREENGTNEAVHHSSVASELAKVLGVDGLYK